MHQSLTIENKKYISTKLAAKMVGYTSDYVGQLYRSGKVEGRMVGRALYVSETSIIEHKLKTSPAAVTKKILDEEEASPLSTLTAAASATMSMVSAGAPSYALSSLEEPASPEEHRVKISIAPEIKALPKKEKHSQSSKSEEPAPKLTVENDKGFLSQLGLTFHEVTAAVLIVAIIFGSTYVYDSNRVASGLNTLSYITDDIKKNVQNGFDILTKGSVERGEEQLAQTSAPSTSSPLIDLLSQPFKYIGEKISTGIAWLFDRNNDSLATEIETEIEQDTFVPYEAPAEKTVSVAVETPAPVMSAPVEQVKKVAIVEEPRQVRTTVIERTVEAPIIIQGATWEELDKRFAEIRDEIKRSARQDIPQLERIYKDISENDVDISELSDLTITGELTITSSENVTIQNNLAVDSNTLFVDAVNNRVGIGSSSPTDTLSVNGPIYLGVSTPADTTNRLYTDGTDIYWSGTAISSSASSWSSSGSNVYRSTGNVGIGTSSPYVALSVEGSSVLGNSATAGYFVGTTTATSTLAGGLSVSTIDVTSTSASSTFANGINLTAGCFSINGTCVTGSGGSGSGTVNSGTTGQIAYYAANGTAVSGTSSLFVSATGNIGIGTTDPLRKFHLSDDGVNGTARVYIEATPGNNGPGIEFAFDGSATQRGLIRLNEVGSDGTEFAFYTKPDGGSLTEIMRLQDSGGLSLGSAYILSDPGINNLIVEGNIGIGTTSPYAKLSVAGEVVATNFTATSTTATSTFAGGVSIAGSTGITILQNGNVGVGTDSPEDQITIEDSVNPSLTFRGTAGNQGWSGTIRFTEVDGFGYLGTYIRHDSSLNTMALGIHNETDSLDANDIDVLTITRSDGFVGIGTTSPYAKLSVAGEVVASHFTGTTTATSTLAGGLQALALNITSTTASSTFANGINLTAGCFAVNGTCITGGGGSGSGTVNSGTTGYVAYYASDTTAVSATSSLFISTAGNVGIGTTTESTAKLTVDGSLKITSSNGAAVLGRVDGNARGLNALDFQTLGSVSTVASGAYSLALGTWNTASAINTTAVGAGNEAMATEAIAIGFYNEATEDSSTAVGNNNNATGTYSVALGSFNNAGGTESSAVGSSNVAYGLYSAAVGYANKASNSSASSVGYANEAYSSESSAFGYTNEVSVGANRGVAFGYANTVSSADASAFGSNITNNIANSTMIGPSNTAKLTILSSGNVGIGTTSPYAKLSVAGEVVASHFTGTTTATSTLAGGLQALALNITSTSASSTFANGINLTSGCFAVNGTCVTGTGGSGSGTVNSGTTGYVAYYASDTTAVSATSSLFIASNGDIGIGTTSPQAKLDLGRMINVNGNMLIGRVDASVDRPWSIGSNGDASTIDQYFVFNGYLDGGVKGNPTFYGSPDGGSFIQDYRLLDGFEQDNDQPGLMFGSFAGGAGQSGIINFAILDNGNIGVGTSSPYAKLSVVGNALVGGNLTATGTLAVQGTGVSSGSIVLDVDGQLSVENSHTSTGDFSEIIGQSIVSQLSNTATGTRIIGVDLSVAKNEDGVLTDVVGVDINFDEFQASTVTNAYGIKLQSFGNSFTNRYGIYLDYDNAATNDYAIYQVDQGVNSYFAGKIGIGTSSPYAALSVEGSSVLGNSATAGYFVGTTTATSTLAGGLQALALNITSTTASSTFANGINLTSGCFAVNGTCITGGGGSGAFASSGGFTTLSTATDNVGIGTSSPYAKLSVVGEVVATNFTATSTTATSSFAGRVAIGPSTIAASSSALTIDTYNGYDEDASFEKGIYLNYSPFSPNDFSTSTAIYLHALFAGGDKLVGIHNAAALSYLDQRAVGLLNEFYIDAASSDVRGVANEFDYFGGSTGKNIYGMHNMIKDPSTNWGPFNFFGLYNDIPSQVSGSDTANVYGTYSIGRTYTGGTKTFYGNYITSGSDSTGGTQYGVYVDLTAGTATKYAGIFNGGNVGIGTSSPYAALSVEGSSVLGNSATAGYFVGTTTATSTLAGGLQALALNITSTSASSTFANGINLTSGCFAVNGTCVTGTGGSGSGTVNSGTTGYVAYYASDTTAVSATSSLFISTAGNVGIGTTSPDTALSVDGSIEASVPNGTPLISSNNTLAQQYFDGEDPSGRVSFIGTRNQDDFIMGRYNSSGAMFHGIQNLSAYEGSVGNYWSTSTALANGMRWYDGDIEFYNEGVRVFEHDDGDFRVYDSNSNTQFIVNSVSNVGIGTTSPYAKLSVAGEVVASHFTGTTTATSTLAGGLQALALNITSTTASSTFANGINLTSGCFAVNGTCITGGGGSGAFASSGGFTTLSTATDNVGIGTSSPYAKLSVVGEVVATNFTATSTTATSSFAGGLDVGSGGLTYEAGSGITYINSLQTGPMSFDTDAGAVSWVDLPVTSTAIAGLAQSYTAQIDSNPVLTVYAESDGAGGIQNSRVGIGTTSPYAKLSVAGLIVGSHFNATTTTATSTFGGFINVNGTGGTSTIAANLHVQGTLRSAVSYVGDLVFSNDFRFIEAPVGAVPRALYLNNQTGENLITYLEGGNIGIGTTTPEYKLHVIGDVAATSFVNISTEEAKTDIDYLEDEDKVDILEKIRDIRVAQYHYKNESGKNPLRLGLIAEEAPSEILSVDGKGVDIYKLSTFVLAGVQEQQKLIDSLSERITFLESGISSTTASTSLYIATSSTAISSSTAAVYISSVVEYFETLGFKIVDSIAHFASVITQSLTVGSKEKPSGITLFDEETGEPYCLKIKSGETVTTKGECTNVSAEEEDVEPADDMVATPVDTNNTQQENPTENQTSTTTPALEDDSAGVEDNGQSTTDGTASSTPPTNDSETSGGSTGEPVSDTTTENNQTVETNDEESVDVKPVESPTEPEVEEMADETDTQQSTNQTEEQTAESSPTEDTSTREDKTEEVSQTESKPEPAPAPEPESDPGASQEGTSSAGDTGSVVQ